MPNMKFKFVTDTATMCVFDLDCLRHRLEDDADWWSIPKYELEEVNLGNVAFLNLSGDGIYSVELVEHPFEHQISVNLRVPSGRIFFGAAEEVSAEGLEPDCTRGGAFVEVESGKYTLLGRKDGTVLTLRLIKSDLAENQYLELVRFTR